MYHRFYTPVVLVLLTTLIINSCAEKKPVAPTNEEKINFLLDMAELNTKTFVLAMKVKETPDVDSLIKKIIYESAELKIKGYETMALTGRCMKNKKSSLGQISDTLQFKNDSMYLSAIESKIREIQEQLAANGDPTIQDVIVVNEKMKSLISEMNQICPQ